MARNNKRRWNLYFRGPDIAMLLILIPILIGSLYSLLVLPSNLYQNLTHFSGVGLILGGISAVLRKEINTPGGIRYWENKGTEAVGIGIFLIITGLVLIFKF